MWLKPGLCSGSKQGSQQFVLVINQANHSRYAPPSLCHPADIGNTPACVVLKPAATTTGRSMYYIADRGDDP
jgi:hypothetical protein